MQEPLDYEKPAQRRSMQNQLRRALINSGVAHVLILLVASTMLDTGITMSLCVAISGGYWAATIMILRRRRNSLTVQDLRFISFGYPVLVLPVAVLICL